MRRLHLSYLYSSSNKNKYFEYNKIDKSNSELTSIIERCIIHQIASWIIMFNYAKLYQVNTIVKVSANRVLLKFHDNPLCVHIAHVVINTYWH